MQESDPGVTLLAPDCCIFAWRVLYRQACSLISQLMTVMETVLPAPGEILDTGRVDLPLSIMNSFKQEMASRSLIFFFFKGAGRGHYSCYQRAGGMVRGGLKRG